MKKNVLGGICVLLLAMIQSEVSAQEVEENQEPIIFDRNESKAKFEERKEQIQQKVEEKRLEIKESVSQMQGERRIKLHEQAQERVFTAIDKVLSRFEAVTVRYDGLTIRIQSRIDKMNQDGLDTSSALQLFIIAQENLDNSVADIAVAREKIKNMLQEESSKETLKALVLDLKTSLRTTHVSYIETVKALKEISLDSEEI